MRILLIPTMSLVLGCATAMFAQNSPAQSQPPQAQTASQSWTGTLVDAQCKTTDPSKPCTVTASTTAFGIVTSANSFAKFDDAGNAMVASKLKTGQTPSKVKVSGKLNGDTIAVESLDLID